MGFFGDVVDGANPFNKDSAASAAGAAGAGVKRKKHVKINRHQAKWTKPELAQLWVEAGGKKEEAALAAVIAWHESHGDAHVVNSIGATGLWQIHPGGAQYKDPLRNARAAVAKRKASSKKWGPNPWQVCKDASCSNLQDEAKNLHVDTSGNPLAGGLPDTAGKAASGIDGLVKPLEAIANFFAVLGQADTWLRILKGLGGALLIILAVFWIIKG